MQNQNKNALLIIFCCLLIFIIAIGIRFAIKQNEYQELIDNYESRAPETVIIENNTFYPVNNLMAIIVNDVLGYDTMSVMIAPMPPAFKLIDDYNFRAFIFKNKFFDHAYLILLADDIKKDEITTILLHEAAHIVQYETGTLQILDYDKHLYLYAGDTIDALKVKYENREYEKDAFRLESVLSAMLDSVLCN